MGFIRVIDAGMLSTVQDLGRAGLSAIGVCEGGAADPLSLRVGNRVVGNEDGVAGVEMTLTGGTVEFEEEVMVVVSGGEVEASIGGRAVGRGEVIRGGAGERLRMGAITRGARAYLCIAGGVRAPTVLGSASTHLGAGFGGFQGRALRAGDRIEFGEGGMSARATVVGEGCVSLVREALERRTLRAVDGAQAREFAPAGAAVFWGSAFMVSAQSDRVGLRLSGAAVEWSGIEVGAAPTSMARRGGVGRMISEGMMWGAVQVPANGEPIVLGADHPTTGGYPVIACVATVDLATLGQLRPGDEVRFERVTVAEARQLYRERERRLDAEVARP